MKSSFFFLSLLFITLTFGCEDDDPIVFPPQDNAFSIEAESFATFNAYLILDDGPIFSDQYGFAFLAGELREDNVNGSSMSTDGTYGSIAWVENSSGTVASEQAVAVLPGIHTLNDESLAFTAVASFTDTYNFGGKTWGEPDINAGDLVEIGQSGNGTLTINSITIDYVLRTGTVDLSYTFTDGNRTVNGTYTGSFGIINEF
jgi:hypothetical protein